ncbi:MAG: hypothetical protein GY694_10030 [Gammaproteobacteria bacterium]|nr:hypothetical protein [Gammaproteobacteria bacterium]
MAATPNTYPNSSVFVNKLGIKNSKELAEAEADFTFLRAEEYRSLPYKGLFDLSHLQQIHSQLFSDLYEWAGQIRQYDIRKDICEFTPYQQIQHHAEKLYLQLKDETFLTRLTQNQFIQRIAYYYDTTNRLHPFPEGNGRTQRLFIEHLALTAGYEVDWSRTQPWQMNEIAIQSFKGNFEPTIFMFEDIVRTSMK